MSTSRDRMKKLPKWAQEEFSRLLVLKGRLEEEIKCLRKDQTESPIFYRDLRKDPIYLPKHTTVCFKMKKGIIDVWISSVHSKEGELLSIGADNGTLKILPHSTNSILLGTEKF